MSHSRHKQRRRPVGIVRKLHGARAEQTAHRAIRLPQSEKAPAPEQAVLRPKLHGVIAADGKVPLRPLRRFEQGPQRLTPRRPLPFEPPLRLGQKLRLQPYLRQAELPRQLIGDQLPAGGGS